MAQRHYKVFENEVFMNENIPKLIDIIGETKVLFSEPLSKYCSFRIGGPADIFYRAKTIKELVTAITSAWNLSIPVFVFGAGTNLLISDRGFRGIAVKNDTGGIKLIGLKGKKTTDFTGEKKSVQTVYLEVESGVSINRLVRFTLDQGLAGLEYFLGQPGTVGGAVYINAHNMKKRVFFGDKVVEAKVLTKDGEIMTVTKDYFHFGYDHSCIQKTKGVVLSITLMLERGDKISLWKEAAETLEYRQKTQPTGVFSSGCTFRNISKSEAVRLATPEFTTSAGFLLDSLGLKGTKKGEAMFSNYHANFIIHRGKASASDVLELILLAKRKVKQRYNIDLSEEIVLVGEF